MRFDPLTFLQNQGHLHAGSSYQLAPLPGGYWNAVYRLQGPDVDWVVKVYRAARPQTLFPILPAAESLALQTLAGRDIAPNIVAFFPARANQNPDLLIYEYLVGATWAAGVQPVARLLHKLHKVTADQCVGWRPLPTSPAGFLAAGDALLAGANDGPATRRLRALRPAIRPVPPLPAPRPVHGDSGTGNLIVTPDGLRLIDWQCPGLGDPAEDLNCFLSPVFQSLYNHPPLSAEEVAAFLQSYSDQATIARYRALQPYLTFRMAAHCCLQAQKRRDTDPIASAAYAKALQLSLELL